MHMPNRPHLQFDGDRAYYNLSIDLVVVPPLTRSIGAEEYYCQPYFMNLRIVQAIPIGLTVKN